MALLNRTGGIRNKNEGQRRMVKKSGAASSRKWQFLILKENIKEG
jgi:hypothetical protein